MAKNVFYFFMVFQLIISTSLMFTISEREAIREIVHEEFLKKGIEVYATAEAVLASTSKVAMEPKNPSVPADSKRNKDQIRKPGAEELYILTNDTDSIETNSLNFCFDMYDSAKCRELRDDFDMCDKDRMKEMCAETCGYCSSRTHAFVDCAQTKYGCCPDEVTAKNDPLGTACINCVDKSPELCQGNEDDCNSIDWVGNWMKKNCQKTCGACKVPTKQECEDDKEQRRFCQSWKKQGLCTEVEELMMKHCRKTCGLCGKTDANHALQTI